MSSVLFNRLRDLALPSGGYAVFGSGPLAVRGIIEACGDLDVLCKPNVWDIVLELGELEFLSDYGVSVVTLVDVPITFGTSWGIGNFDVNKLIESAEIIESLPFVSLEHVIAYKTIRRSDKDRQHLDALTSYASRTD